VAGDRLELHRALIGRSIRTIPLDRIRGVDISTPPLHRLLGLAVVRIDTGASGVESQEGELNALTVDEAERVRALLLERAAATHAAPEGGPAPEPGTARGAGAGTVPGTAADGGEASPAEPERVLARVPRSWLAYG